MGRVVIGMDPHKRSATIEVIDEQERVLAQGRYATDTDGYRLMLAAGRAFPARIWAVEGLCRDRPAHRQRLVADGETVVDVPAKLSARVRVFGTGQGRKTDPVDAHSVAVAGLRSQGPRHVAADDTTVALRLLVDRRDELGRTRTQLVSRMHRLLLELIPGGAKKYLTRGQAGYLLCTMAAPVDLVAQTRHQLACDLVEELTTIDAKIKVAKKQLHQLLATTGTSLRELNGIGPAGAARLVGDIATSTASPPPHTSPRGTAPPRSTPPPGIRNTTASPRAGNRRINRALHIMAVVQLRHDTPGRPTAGDVWPRAKPRWKPCGP